MNSSASSVFDLTPMLMQILVGFVPIALITITIVGNCLTFYVYSRKSFAKVSATFYLKTMAMLDSLNLIQVIGFSVPYAFGVDLKSFSSFSCKLLFFGAFFSHNMSSWCETLVALDRCLAIKFRAKLDTFNKLWFKLTATVGILLLNSPLYWPMLAYFRVLTPAESSNMSARFVGCYSSNGIYFKAFGWADLFATILVPFSVMFVSTLFLVSSLVSSRKRMLNRFETKKARTQNDGPKSSVNRQQKVSKTSQRERRDFQFALTSISLNALSLLLNLPIGVYLIYMVSFSSQINNLLFMLSNIFLHLNLSYKFFLYLTVNTKFREEFFQTISFIKRRNN